MNPLERAIEIAGLQDLARCLNVSYQAVMKWVAAGRLPRSEFSGETTYASTIQDATNGSVTADELIDWSRKGWTKQVA